MHATRGLPVMCSTSKLPVKTHDQATDHMVNLPIQNGKKKWEEVKKEFVKPTLPEVSPCTLLGGA